MIYNYGQAKQTSIFVLRYIRKRHGLIIHTEINHIAVKNETAWSLLVLVFHILAMYMNYGMVYIFVYPTNIHDTRFN